MRPSATGRFAFTLIELLVVVAIIALLTALISTSVVKAREAARSSLCQANLRNAGVGMMLYAQRSPNNRLCSGAFDHSREGCMDRYGWVADLRNVGMTDAETVLCPSNTMRVNEKLLDAYGLPTNDGLNDLTGPLRARYNHGMCGQQDWDGISGSGSPSSGFASTDELTDERRALVTRYFVESGLNTNYATSWFLIHTAPRIQYRESDNSIRTAGQAAQQGLRGKRETLGPLSVDFLAVTDIPQSNIPLLGDASPGDIDEAITPIAFAYDSTDIFARGDSTERTFAAAGTILCESASEGPTYYHTGDREIKRIGSNGSRLETQWKCELDGSCEPPTGGAGNRMYLQSTLAWAGTHAGSGGFAINLLFADGSVRSFSDRNGDLYLNPGFPIPGTLTEDQLDATGYRNNEVELHPSEVFSGVFLAPSMIKGVHE